MHCVHALYLSMAYKFQLFSAVSRYQHEDMKRAIIRLEQGAHSYMHRSIASHGAFAVIYGRHSKHYIKKPEVFQSCKLT